MGQDKGRPDHFDAIYKEYYAPLYRFVYSLLGCAEETGDIVQESFIKLYSQLQADVKTDNPKAWLYRVTANSCCNVLKRKKKFRLIMERNFHTDDSTSTNHNMEAELIKNQETQILRKAMNKLPPRDQVILTLYKNGFSTADIAETIRVKKNSVGKTLARSIAKLSGIITKGLNMPPEGVSL